MLLVGEEEMVELVLTFENGHLFVEIDGASWLIDTGAPESFGDNGRVELAGRTFEVSSGYMGLDTRQLTEFVGIPCRGLLGADILGEFDTLFDAPANRLTLSEGELQLPGMTVPLDHFMGIPIVEVGCAGRTFRFFFDTGAQISYLQDGLLTGFPALGNMKDFYPGFGEFETATHEILLELGGTPLTVRCGQLPGLLGMSLAMADVRGILGNSFMAGRTVGYSPRRGLLCP